MSEFIPAEKQEGDNCGCWKPKGCYGEGGWHWKRLDLSGSKRMVLDKLVGEYARQHANMKPDAKKMEELEKSAASSAPNYVGTLYGYEKCPRYAEAHRSHVEKVRDKRRQERRGKRKEIAG